MLIARGIIASATDADATTNTITYTLATDIGGGTPYPGPFSIDDPDRLARILAEGGLDEIAVSEYPTPYRDSSFESMWTRVVALAGPLAKMLAAQPPEAVEAIRTRMHDSLSAYEGPGGFDIPGVSLLGSGRRVG